MQARSEVRKQFYFINFRIILANKSCMHTRYTLLPTPILMWKYIAQIINFPSILPIRLSWFNLCVCKLNHYDYTRTKNKRQVTESLDLYDYKYPNLIIR